MQNKERLATIAKRGYGSVAGGPFALDEWALATDGHIAVLVPAVDGESLPPAPESVAGAVRRWIALHPTNQQELTVSSLRDFATPLPCSKCRNTRFLTCMDCSGRGGTVACECSKCGHEHEITCDCDNGKVPCWSCSAARIGTFLGKKINTRLLDDVLNTAADKRDISAAVINLNPRTKQRGQANEAIILKPNSGDLWIAFIMPMVDSAESVITYDEARK